MHALRSNFLDINWEYHNDDFNNLNATAKLYASIKFLITVTGSNGLKMVFMQPNTCVVIVCTDIYDFSVYLEAQVINVKTVVFAHPGHQFTHFNSRGGNINVKRLVTATEIGLYYIKKGEWPDPTKYDGFIL